MLQKGHYVVVFKNPVMLSMEKRNEETNGSIRKQMKVININHSSGKVVGASAFFVQFLWLHWKSVEWICLQWEPQQSRLGMDDTETICVQTLRPLDGTFPWHIVKSRLSHKVLNFSIISLWYALYILLLLLICSCNSSFHQSNNWPNVHPKDNKQVTFACFSRLQFDTGDVKAK